MASGRIRIRHGLGRDGGQGGSGADCACGRHSRRNRCGPAGPPLAAFDASGHGTIFTAPDPKRARKAWLAGRMQVVGRLHVDAGAATALAGGKSLLAAGVTRVEGDFHRGDAVDVLGPNGRPIARGLVAYDAADARAIAGKRSDAIAAILGYAPRSAMLHRDQLVML
jgi:glutamate 5-kinase